MLTKEAGPCKSTFIGGGAFVMFCCSGVGRPGVWKVSTGVLTGRAGELISGSSGRFEALPLSRIKGTWAGFSGPRSFCPVDGFLHPWVLLFDK